LTAFAVVHLDTSWIKACGKMPNFAIDSLLEIGYILAAPQGVNGKDI
jgi:hypothetical protein